jgi:hypothetical protein
MQPSSSSSAMQSGVWSVPRSSTAPVRATETRKGARLALSEADAWSLWLVSQGGLSDEREPETCLNPTC